MAFSKEIPLKLSVPAKTFLVGEYLALSGGPSLVITTLPRFELETDPQALRNPFAFASPAGKLWESDPLKPKLKFRDPFEEAGGLGASTAQFALLYAALRGKESVTNLRDLLSTYRE